MEGLRNRVIVLGAVFVAVGVAFILTSKTVPLRDEAWMVKNTPKKFANFSMVPGQAGPEITYKMDKYTYETLKPYGIVARVFSGTDRGIRTEFDAVIIMSNNKESFHDPRVCFTATGWQLGNVQTVTVPTKTHGPVSVTLAELSQGNNRSMAAFFYRGPEGFCATTGGLKLQMLKKQFFQLKDSEGAFYRIIPQQSSTSKEQLFSFIDEWLAATNQSSGGLL
jgi:hypothetical protein